MAQQDKSDQLGMPFGTACNRLRKALLHHLADQLDLLDCYRCGERIETTETLSIEHMRDWFGRDTDLFWDVENLAFSHRKCNRPNLDGDRPPRMEVRRRDEGPPGTAWCGPHEEYLPVEDFNRNRSRWNGLADRCKSCRALTEREEPKPRDCRTCGQTEVEVEMMPNRRRCIHCYRDSQKDKMRERRS